MVGLLWLDPSMRAVDAMEYRILGPVEVREDGRQLPLVSPTQRAILASLLLHANRVVPIESLIDDLWGDAPPETARISLQNHISRLRKVLQPKGGGRPAGPLVTHAPGYLLEVEDGQLDWQRFQQLLQQARAARTNGDLALAAEHLRAALALWRGPALADIASGPLRQSATPSLEEVRLAAIEERVDVELLLGRHDELVAELESLVTHHPLRERLWAQLMLALYRSGRQGEALGAYRKLRRVLHDELGLEPSTALQQLERQILTADPALEAPSRLQGGPPPASLATPQQLPPDIDDFTGRASVLSEMRARLAGKRKARPAVRVVALAGKAGVGKTALAVRVAHELMPCFPDGQLWVDLRGVEDEARDPADVLAEFLRALGVDGTAIPEGLDERVRLYRSRLAGGRVLAVLDNAASEAQVRPLLPGGPRCAALVTSRVHLAGLESAHVIDVDLLDPAEAVEFLAKVVGPVRVAREPKAAATLTGLCGYLPLAVRIAGARLAARRHWPLARLAERLSDERRRLDELVAGDLEVRASVALSYQGLTQQEQRAFRLLGLLDVGDFPAWAMARVVERDIAATEELLDRLVDLALLDVAAVQPGGPTRYRFHDLLGIFARDCLREEPATVRTAALRRGLVAYLAAASRAAARLELGLVDERPLPQQGRRQLDPAVAQLIDRDPTSWFVTERANLVAAVAQAYRAGQWELAWELASATVPFFNLSARWDDWLYTHELGLDAARRAEHRRGEAVILRGLGELHQERGHLGEAKAAFGQALALYREVGDRRGEATTIWGLAEVCGYEGRLEDAQAAHGQALALYREVGDRLGEAHTLHTLGSVLRQQQRLDEASAVYERSLELYRQLGSLRWEAYSLLFLGALHRDRGCPEQAIDYYRQSLAVFRTVRDRIGEGSTLRDIGLAYREQHRPDEAVARLEACLRIFRELGYQIGEACGLHDLGDVYQDLGRLDEAVDCYRQAVSIFGEHGFRLREGRALRRLGVALSARKDLEGARAAWREALAIFQGTGAPEAIELERWLHS